MHTSEEEARQKQEIWSLDGTRTVFEYYARQLPANFPSS